MRRIGYARPNPFFGDAWYDVDERRDARPGEDAWEWLATGGMELDAPAERGTAASFAAAVAAASAVFPSAEFRPGLLAARRGARDPLALLLAQLRADGRPSLRWSVRWSEGGREPLAAAYAASGDPEDMLTVLGVLTDAAVRGAQLAARLGWSVRLDLSGVHCRAHRIPRAGDEEEDEKNYAAASAALADALRAAGPRPMTLAQVTECYTRARAAGMDWWNQDDDDDDDDEERDHPDPVAVFAQAVLDEGARVVDSPPEGATG